VSIQIQPEHVNWSDAGRLDGRPLLILLHGYGQDEHGLDIIAAEVADGFATAALRGPREAQRPGVPGYCWYQVDERIVPLPGQAEETVAGVLDWLDAVIGERGTPSSIGIVGFSQGAALTLQLLRTTPERWGAVATLAGYWLDLPAAGDDRLVELRPQVFWGRTEADPAIAPEYIAATRAALAPFAPEAEHVYPGDEHAIVSAELIDVSAFLLTRLSP
jgi:phospholipase/carboxylesterase